LGGVALLVVPSIAADGKSAEWLVLGVLSLHVLCFMPTLGLTNTLAFHHVTSQEKQFPFIRVFGTIGWIVANNILSWLHWDVKPEQFYLAGGAALLLGFYSLALPHTPPPAAGKKAEARDILGLDALALMRQRSFAVFVVCSFLICIPLAAYYQLAGTFARSSGFTETASAMSWGQVSEIFFMLAMPLFFLRLGVKKMLLVGMLAWAVRYAFFGGAAPAGGLVIPPTTAPVV